MADYIQIYDLLVRAIVGINPDEREHKQDVLINLKFEVDTLSAAKGDDLKQTVNYRTICKDVIRYVEQSEFLLVEALAEGVAEQCLKDSRVQRVWVSIEKPGALRFARSVGVTIERSQPQK